MTLKKKLENILKGFDEDTTYTVHCHELWKDSCGWSSNRMIQISSRMADKEETIQSILDRWRDFKANYRGHAKVSEVEDAYWGDRHIDFAVAGLPFIHLKTHEIVPDFTEEIYEAMAKVFFATAWADYQEDSPDGVNLSGCDIYQVMPAEIPDEVYASVRECIRKLLWQNDMDLMEMYDEAERHKLEKPYREFNMENFGEILAFQCLGHGIGFEEICETPEFSIDIPHHEFRYYELDEEEYPCIEEQD